MNTIYRDFLVSKKEREMKAAKPIVANPHALAKPHQRDCLEFLLRITRGAAFLDTGLGKTFLQIDFVRHIPGKSIIVAPLGVCHQTIREAKKMLGVDVVYSPDGEITSKITITNYDRLHLFDSSQFEAVVLDESSILKGKNSKTKNRIIEMFSNTPYRLACTATPAPNDYTEIGNHAEFLGIMSTQEMLTRWFVHDSMNTGDWRLKKHAVVDFWGWVSSWAACISKPSDLGYSDEGYDLKPAHFHTHDVASPLEEGEEGELFKIPDYGATSLHKNKRSTIEERCEIVAKMVNESDEPWIVWCESNDESAMLAKMIPAAVEVKGADSGEKKESSAHFFLGYELSEKELCLIGKMSTYEEWKILHINKNTIVQIGIRDSLSPRSTAGRIEMKKSNISKSIIDPINPNTKEQEISKTRSIGEEGRNTPKIKSIEKNRRRQLENSTPKILESGSPKELENSESRSINSMTCMKKLKGAVRFADLRTTETQGFSLSSITAINQGKFAGFYAANAILQSGTLMTILSEFDLQSIIFPARKLISKSSIFGYGLNFQHCRKMAFVSISYSYEKFYQAVRRIWRFGQTEEVDIHVVLVDSEFQVWRQIEAKTKNHEEMKSYMKLAIFNPREKVKVKIDYNPTIKASLPTWMEVKP
jgi:hypothetical protein